MGPGHGHLHWHPDGRGHRMSCSRQPPPRTETSRTQPPVRPAGSEPTLVLRKSPAPNNLRRHLAPIISKPVPASRPEEALLRIARRDWGHATAAILRGVKLRSAFGMRRQSRPGHPGTCGSPPGTSTGRGRLTSQPDFSRIAAVPRAVSPWSPSVDRSALVLFIPDVTIGGGAGQQERCVGVGPRRAALHEAPGIARLPRWFHSASS